MASTSQRKPEFLTEQADQKGLKISVVIPTCHRAADLERCLGRLMPQAADVRDCEVIVTDDANIESTRPQLAVQFPAVIWTQGPQRGPAANRNHGASIARGEWLVFLDDDLAPEHGFVASIAESVSQAPNHDIFEGVILNDRPLPSLLWEAPFNDRDCPQLSCSAAFCIRASTFRDIGGFDERYKSGVYAEDMEFSARLLAVGTRKKFVPGAVVIHPIRNRPGALKLARRWEGLCINARDQGASQLRMSWNLPWHALRVIQSRFRGKKWSAANIGAAFRFTGEFLCVLALAPAWAAKWSRLPRSKFWETWVKQHGPAPKYGF